MSDRERILRLIPHAGRSCLLDAVVAWDDGGITCRATSHGDPANPLRRAGALHAVHGAEYGLQAAALHGGLLAERDGAGRTGGWLVSLRDVRFEADRLDDRADALLVEAVREHAGPAGSAYGFTIRDARGATLVSGRGTVARPPG